jgi:hypothetical protein
VFDGSEAAVATISLEVVPSAELLETIKSAEHVFDASVVAG